MRVTRTTYPTDPRITIHVGDRIFVPRGPRRWWHLLFPCAGETWVVVASTFDKITTVKN